MAVRNQFDEQLQNLHHQLLTMGMLVEEALHQGVKALVDKNVELAQEVIDGDREINDAEMDIERKCFTLIALQQPVGSDLRRIATTLKVSTDLERIADHAVSIAKTTVRLQGEAYAKPLIDIPKMGKLVQEMVRDALDAYIRMDKDEAKIIANRDDQVDALYKKIFTDLVGLMTHDQSLINQATHLLLTAQYLERIGDYVTNICEWIVYMESGNKVELNQ
ncbi:phosphate signaling complex protein PhoU [Siminovitchia fortis]|uniref:Phosphate-specific transport system accessory protein PhoU n=1 Tax=Siminovitchia fortis TaxID=254758 RepID=A0A451GCR5_9BACI|nr:phosphate signaling complex protein PhoU [Siminovitchia fortis]RWR13195.1 phosphate signaling complex protein PhoU [Siminovitchia fortis]WHY82022.1 phosphate signaling complex protein PhoU [Siminovitchia fortis]